MREREEFTIPCLIKAIDCGDSISDGDDAADIVGFDFAFVVLNLFFDEITDLIPIGHFSSPSYAF